MKRRFFLSTLAAGSTGLLLPTPIKAHLLTDGKQVSLGCLGHATPAKYLDGRTRDGSVGLAPELSRKFPGTKWRVRGMGKNAVALECQGSSGGPRWLDGRTAHGTVGLAPNTKKPFTGTRWEIVQVDGKNPDIVALKCLGDIQGPRWLDGRTTDGTVALVSNPDPPFTGTRWEVKLYGIKLANPEGRPAKP